MSKRQIPAMVTALVRCAADKDKLVKKSIADSLRDIGRHEPNLVVEKALFFIKDSKPKEKHTIALLNVITRVLDINMDEIEQELAFEVIDLAIEEMTKDIMVNPDYQTACSEVLICFHSRYPNEIVDKLLELFPTGDIPHYFVLKTIADLASANCVDIVPRLGDIFSRMIPVLGSLKRDNMRWVFASSIRFFCEAIMAYQVDVDVSKIEISSFSSQVFTAFDLLFTSPQWIGSSETRVRLATIQAIGAMSMIISETQFKQQFDKLLKGFVELYSKESSSDLLAVTQGLYNVLNVALKHAKLELEEELHWLLDSLLPQVCKPIDYKVSSTLKNNNELMRVIEILTRGYTDTLLGYLLGKLEDPNFIVREATMNIMKHNITRIIDEFATKKEIILAGLQSITQTETNNRVKKALAQVIISMAPKGYLGLEGGDRMIEFIILNSSISDEEIENYREANKKNKNKDPEAVSPLELRNMCDHILSLMTTTIPEMEDALWPFLLEPVASEQFVPSMAVLTKCIAHISGVKRDSGSPSYMIDFEKEVNLPKPHQIMARLLVLMNFPKRRGNLAGNVMETIKNLGPIINDNVVPYWDETIPGLIDFLSSEDPDFDLLWEIKVQDFVKQTASLIGNEKWLINLCDSMFIQLSLYEQDRPARETIFKFTGLILSQVSNDAYIRDTLGKVFSTTDHTNEEESSGCAKCYGFASEHINIVLNSLEEQIDGPPVVEEPKKKKGFFSFLSSTKSTKKYEATNYQIRTIISAYSHIVIISDSTRIMDILEDKVMSRLRTYFESEDFEIRRALVTTFDLISKKIREENKTDTGCVLNQRDELLSVLLNFLSKEESNPEPWKMRILSMNAISNLVVLDPIIPRELETQIIDQTTSLLPQSTGEQGTDEIFLDTFNRLYLTILEKDLNMECVIRLIDSMIQMTTTSIVAKNRSLGNMISFLKVYLKKVRAEGDETTTEFDKLGDLLGFMVPRFTDSDSDVRGQSVEFLQLVLFIDYILKKRAEGEDIGDGKPPAAISSLSSVRKRLAKVDDVNEQYSVVHKLSGVLAEIIDIADITPFLKRSLSGLMEGLVSCCRGTCVVLFGILGVVSARLEQDDLVILSNMILDKLVLLTNEQVKTGVLNALKCIAVSDIELFFDIVMKRSVPFHSSLSNLVTFLFKDTNLAPHILKHVTTLLDTTEIFEEIMETEESIPTPVSLAATHILSLIFTIPKIPNLDAYFPVIFCTLLLRVGTSKGYEVHRDETITAIKNWINALEEPNLLEILQSNNTFEKIKGSNYNEGVVELTATIIKPHAKAARSIFKILSKFIGAKYEEHQIVTAYVLGEFLNHCEDSKLIEHIVNGLLPCLSDNILKRAALKGLGNIVSAPADQYNKYAPTILDALMERIDDKTSTTALEAMNSLSKLLEVVEKERVIPFLKSLSERITKSFDNPSSGVRVSALSLYGVLLNFGELEESKDFFLQEVHRIFPSVLIRINDIDSGVRSQSRNLMVKIVNDFLPTEELKKIIETSHIFSVNKDINYHDFLRQHLAKALIACFPERINSYLTTLIEVYFISDHREKSNALLCVGTLMLHLSNSDTIHILELDPIYVAREIVALLKETNADVRLSASEALSMMQEY
eukprot:TRINITY_DN4560_c0_g1_i1.p1 TRINITY_DN4560_c0_g1~~TRINITY_DN4560_c0_g1_i1.p1  ORF type:complete len:1619 (+),score=365.55 TRINITY_DN4560_c0_g1_i1:442-5298(+)